MLNRIPDYPPPARALDGSEPLAAWQDGKQRALPILQVALVALEQLMKELDPSATAYGAWLRLPGNAGKSIEDFLRSLIGPPGPGADVLFRRADYVATAGQTRFPAEGEFPWIYDPRIMACFVNGKLIGRTGYVAPGNLVPPVFAQPRQAGDEVIFLSFVAAAQALGLKDFAFSIRKSAYQKMTEAIALDDARENNATDENDALAELLNDGYRSIHLVGNLGSRNGRYAWGAIPFKGLREGFKPGQPGYIPNDPNAAHYEEHPGSFTLANGQKAHGLTLFGDGMGRTFVDQIDNYMLAHTTGSEDVNDNLLDLTIRDMTLAGRGGPDAIGAEHLLAMAGVTRLTLLRARLMAFRGDGLMLWPGPSGRMWNHNEDVEVLHSVFDGVNNRNRNGLSGEDITGLLVFGSRFFRIGVSDDGVSVGDIDIEPRAGEKYRVGQVNLVSNRHVGSGRAAVAFYVNGPSNYLQAPQGFTVRNAFIMHAHRGVDCLGVFNPFFAEMTKKHLISITGSQMIDVEQPLRAGGTYGLEFRGNPLENVGSLTIGVDGIGRGNKDILVTDNPIYRGGRTNGAAILIDDATYGDSLITRNPMTECGIQSRRDGPGWPILMRYGQQSVRIIDNPIINTEGRLKADISMGTDASIGAGAANRGNVVTGTALVAGNFNPPSAPTGIYRDFTFPGNSIIYSGSSVPFDISVEGAFVGMSFDPVPLFAIGARMGQAGCVMDCFVKETYVVRLTIAVGQNLDLSGQTIRILQRS